MVIGPDNIIRRIPWCYTLDGQSLAQVRLYTGNDHGGGGDGGSARRTEYDNDDLIKSHNFLAQLWRAIPNPKPVTHQTTWDKADTDWLDLHLEAKTSLTKTRDQDAFRVDVSVWGKDLDRGKGGKDMAVVVHEPSDAGSGRVTTGSATALLPVRFRHVPSRSPSRSPPGNKKERRR
ncbi:hypothetical protein Micbo1qcDRAFT_167901, partial [Microdochium bolleyi]